MSRLGHAFATICPFNPLSELEHMTMVGMGFRRIALAQGLLDRADPRAAPPALLAAGRTPGFVSAERAPFYPRFDSAVCHLTASGNNDTAQDRVSPLD